MKDALIEIPGWLMFWYLFVGQCIPGVHYEWGVAMGTQDPDTTVTEVGVAFWKGFATADLVFYVPLLGYGLWTWNYSSLAAALGVTVYWPIVCLVAASKARDAPGWSLDTAPFYVVLPIIILWACASLYRLPNVLVVRQEGNQSTTTNTTTANQEEGQPLLQPKVK